MCVCVCDCVKWCFSTQSLTGLHVQELISEQQLEQWMERPQQKVSILLDCGKFTLETKCDLGTEVISRMGVERIYMYLFHSSFSHDNCVYPSATNTMLHCTTVWMSCISQHSLGLSDNAIVLSIVKRSWANIVTWSLQNVCSWYCWQNSMWRVTHTWHTYM